MRARSIKPGFFSNEVLGSADPLYGLLFAGLWLAADREGRLEDRPLRICAQLFPYRRQITEKRCDAMLEWLRDRGFIHRYEVGGKHYIQVMEFLRHQNPHVKEAPSKIPALSSKEHKSIPVLEPVDHRTGTVLAPDKHGSSPASSLTPDSGLRTPDSHKTPNPPQVGAVDKSRGRRVNGTHARAVAENPRANGTHPRAQHSNPRSERAALKAAGPVPIAAVIADAQVWAPLVKRGRLAGFRAARDGETAEAYKAELEAHEGRARA